MSRKLGAAVFVLAALLTLGYPSAALARGEHGGGSRGGHGFSQGGRGYGGGRQFRGGGRGFGGGAYRGGGGYYGGRGYYRGRGFEGRNFRGGHRDWDDYGRGYYGGGLYFGYGGPYAYGYAPGACGYYDAWGYWHPDPACYSPYSYGYGY